ncbi:hypothetical protein FRC08_009948 [Ceratobasidium sp. 394]|nr:hypothetical protein FRC08_009948 [Ceratobasidium sp. 394]
MDAKVLAVRDNVLELALNAPRPNEFLAKYPAAHLAYPDYPVPNMWTLFEEHQSLVLPDPDDVRDLRTRFNYVRDELGPLSADYFILLFLRRAIIKGSVASGDEATEPRPPSESWTRLEDAYRHHGDRINKLADGLNASRIKSWFTPKLFLLSSDKLLLSWLGYCPKSLNCDPGSRRPRSSDTGTLGDRRSKAAGWLTQLNGQ